MGFAAVAPAARWFRTVASVYARGFLSHSLVSTGVRQHGNIIRVPLRALADLGCVAHLGRGIIAANRVSLAFAGLHSG